MKWNVLYQSDPRSLSSTEFVEPPLPEQNSWVRHWSHFLLIISYKFIPYTVSNMPGRLGADKRDRTPGADRGLSDKKNPLVLVAMENSPVRARYAR